jgi:hypothetical protein
VLTAPCCRCVGNAGPGDEVVFFPVTDDVLAFIIAEYPETLPTQVRAQLGIDAENRHLDVGIQGRATYEPALRIGVTSSYVYLRQYVLSRTIADSPDPAVEIVRGDPLGAVRALKASRCSQPSSRRRPSPSPAAACSTAARSS